MFGERLRGEIVSIDFPVDGARRYGVWWQRDSGRYTRPVVWNCIGLLLAFSKTSALHVMTQPSASTKSRPEKDEPDSHGKKLALRSFRAHLRLWLVAAAGFAVDQASKAWAIRHLGNPDIVQSEPLVIIRDYLSLSTVHNTGAVAGLAAGYTGWLVLASVVALGLLVWFFAVSRANQWVTHIALGVLLAGALGNMYDRIFNNGKVIDFIEVNLHIRYANPWPTFNVADAWLCIGVAVLILTALKPRPS